MPWPNLKSRLRPVPRRRKQARHFKNHRFGVEQLEGRRLLTAVAGGALAGAEGEGSLTARFRLETVDSSGQSADEFGIGDAFDLRVYVEDPRMTPTGVFSPYLDINYDTGLVTADSTLTLGSTYTNFPSGDLGMDGLIDEAGAFDGLQPLGGGEFLVFSARFTAHSAGSVTFSGSPADMLPDHELLVYGSIEPVLEAAVDYGTTTITITDARTVDDGAVGYSEIGVWESGGLPGAFQQDYRYQSPGTGNNAAQWTFNDVPDGNYRVLASWTAHANRATNASFQIRDGSVVEANPRVNQRLQPNDVVAGGQAWESLGTFAIDNGSVSVVLTDAADGIVVADAIRLESTAETPPPPPPAPTGNHLVDDGDSGYAESGSGWATGGLTGAYEGDYRFNLPGNGSSRSTWSVSQLTPGNYDIYASWTTHANRADNARFDISSNGSLVGSATRNQRQTPDDMVVDGTAFESLGTFAVDSTLTVTLTNAANGIVIADAIYVMPSEGDPPPPPPPPPPTPGNDSTIVDDGDAMFRLLGNWEPGGLAGAFGGDYRFHAPGSSGSTAEWEFDVAAGRYAVFATWTAHSNRASNASYTVLDGGSASGVQQVNQRVAPSSIFADGQHWHDLGEHDAANGSLRVQLSGAANGIVIADAIRIVPTEVIDPPDPGPPPAVDRVIDNGAASYQEFGGGWETGGLAGAYGGDYRFRSAGSGSSTARWQTTLAAGTYEIFASWTAHANRAHNAAFTLRDGNTLLTNAERDQRQTPNDLSDSTGSWESLGTVVITNGNLTVQLSDDADGVVIADSIRVRSV